MNPLVLESAFESSISNLHDQLAVFLNIVAAITFSTDSTTRANRSLGAEAGKNRKTQWNALLLHREQAAITVECLRYTPSLSKTSKYDLYVSSWNPDLHKSPSVVQRMTRLSVFFIDKKPLTTTDCPYSIPQDFKCRTYCAVVRKCRQILSSFMIILLTAYYCLKYSVIKRLSVCSTVLLTFFL